MVFIWMKFMRRKKFSKERFYHRLEAQSFVKGGYVNWNGELEHWQLPYCNFPDLAKSASKAAEKFQEMAESLIGLRPPTIKTIKTNIFIDGFDLGSAKDFSITYSRT